MELVRDRVVVVIGFIAYSFDMTSKTWKRCHDSRRDRGYFASIYYQGKVYAIRTYSLMAAGTVEKFNPFVDNWVTVTLLPRKLRSLGAASHALGLYVIGGIESYSEIVISSILKLNEEADQKNHQDPDLKLSAWVDIGVSLLRPRYRHATVDYKGNIWIAGGCFEDLSATNTVEVFNPNLLTVMEGPSMLFKRDFVNVLVIKSELYAVGGDMDEVANQTLRSIEKLNDADQRWIHVTPIKDTRRGFSTCAYESKIFVFVGSDDSNKELRT